MAKRDPLEKAAGVRGGLPRVDPVAYRRWKKGAKDKPDFHTSTGGFSQPALNPPGEPKPPAEETPQ